MRERIKLKRLKREKARIVGDELSSTGRGEVNLGDIDQ
jgi:hypothetical protein